MVVLSWGLGCPRLRAAAGLIGDEGEREGFLVWHEERKQKWVAAVCVLGSAYL